MNLSQSKDSTVVILAGGKSRRFENRIKALEIYNGISLLGHRIRLANEIFSIIIISVSSDEIKLKYENQLRSENIDLSNIAFIIDQEEAQGPMKALFYIFTQITTKYCAVIGVDNILIRNVDFQILQDNLISSKASLISVLLNKTRLVASFFTFEVGEILNILTIYPFIKSFERITDLFRIVPVIAFLDVNGTGQYINVNTPEDLDSLEVDKTNYIDDDNVVILKPKYSIIKEISCDTFIQELKCWSKPNRIEHIVNNILKDAKRELKDDFINCKFNDYGYV